MNNVSTKTILTCAVLFAGVAVGQGAATRDAVDKPGAPYGILRKPIPEKMVVLTFDDACLSHATEVGPLLKKYGLRGTFYVSDAFGFRTRKDWYMTWEQIKGLDDLGFEIGNYTLGHGQLNATGLEGCLGGLRGIEEPGLQDLRPARAGRLTAQRVHARCRQRHLAVAAGLHTLAFTLGEGESMDLIDNVVIGRMPPNE